MLGGQTSGENNCPGFELLVMVSALGKLLLEVIQGHLDVVTTLPFRNLMHFLSSLLKQH